MATALVPLTETDRPSPLRRRLSPWRSCRARRRWSRSPCCWEPTTEEPAALAVLATVLLEPTTLMLSPLPAVLGPLIVLLSPKAKLVLPLSVLGSPIAKLPLPLTVCPVPNAPLPMPVTLYRNRPRRFPRCSD